MTNRISGSIAVVVATTWICVLGVSPASAQGDDVFGGKGIQSNRDYTSLLPWEHVDVVSGSLVLTFTDLVLPGNAGRALRFQRTFNSKDGIWTFGIAGLPMLVYDPRGEVPASRNFNPSDPDWFLQPEYAALTMADNGQRLTAFPLSSTEVTTIPGSKRYLGTAEFWVYDRELRTLRLPDGTTCLFDGEGRLFFVRDAFDNTVSLDYDMPSAGQITVHQPLSPTEVRDIVITLSPTSGTTSLPTMPTSMTFDGKTWSYAGPGNVGSTVTLPEGVTWQYVQDFGDPVDTLTVTTPQGGTVEYTIELRSYNPPPPQQAIWTRVLRTRTANDGVRTATWQYDYTLEFPDSGQPGTSTITEPPVGAGGSGRTIAFAYGNPSAVDCAGSTSPNILVPARWFAVYQRSVADATRTWEEETRTYRCVPVRSTTTTDGMPELASQTLKRYEAGGTQTYATSYAYASTDYGDYHQPESVTETGPTGGSRQTTRTYRHAAWDVNMPTAIYIVGLPLSQTVEANGSTLRRDWDYEANGFRKSETAWHTPGASGLTTTFTMTNAGNIAQAQTGSQTTTFDYDWGQVSLIQTSAHATTRVINQDGTVASETQNGRTTSYMYDDLGRVTHTQPPGTNGITTAYSATTVTTSRGDSFVTTGLDGFGRPTGTVNSVAVRTLTEYDAEGRKTFESYPFDGTVVGKRLSYDALDRVSAEQTFDNATTSLVYGADSTTTTDEEGRTTTYSRLAFGHPDDAWLVRVHDASGNDWTYGYDALGTLTQVSGPPVNGQPVTRTWVYNAQHLLGQESHPESGTVNYTVYDGAGLLLNKTDAQGTLFQYAYDGNGRLTSITAGAQATAIIYEPGSDNRALTTVDGVTSAFTYDFAGRLRSRSEIVDGRAFDVLFTYDGNDNIQEIAYPSGRRIGYLYDSENRMTRVFNAYTQQIYASNFDYHPSGGIQQYLTSNGVQTLIGYHPTRYWASSIDAGQLHLGYQYDLVGNVLSMLDSRANMSQTFTYDVLDRLKTVSSAGYPSMVFAYDAHGNRVTTNGEVYYPGTFRLQSFNGLTMTYDDNGNLKTGPQATYVYRPNNMMQSSTVAGVTANYGYSADDARVKKAVAGGATTYYLRGLNGELLIEWKNTTPNAEVRDYVYAGSRLIGVFTATQPAR